jgi:exonuclease III
MKILSWNCRGLGNPRAVRALLRLIKLENPQLVFLMETRLKSEEMENIRLRCSFNSCLAVSCKGFGKERAGGLACLWRDDWDVVISSFSLNHIMGYFSDEGSGELVSFS